jgi:hypothetical protein
MRHVLRARVIDTAHHWISRRYVSVAPLRLALCTGPQFFKRLQDADRARALRVAHAAAGGVLQVLSQSCFFESFGVCKPLNS